MLSKICVCSALPKYLCTICIIHTHFVSAVPGLMLIIHGMQVSYVELTESALANFFRLVDTLTSLVQVGAIITGTSYAYIHVHVYYTCTVHVLIRVHACMYYTCTCASYF